MKVISSIVFFFNLSIYSFASEYQSEVVCSITNDQTTTSVRHNLWHTEQETWNFEINLNNDNYQGTFKLDQRNVYIELKNLNSNTTSTKISDFSIGGYAPTIATKIDNTWLICQANSETKSLEWEYILMAKLDLPIKLFRTKLESIIKFAGISPQTDQEENDLNKILCYFIGNLEKENLDLNHFITSTLANRTKQFPNVMNQYIENILTPTNNMKNFCSNSIDKKEASSLAQEILKTLEDTKNFIHAQSLISF